MKKMHSPVIIIFKLIYNTFSFTDNKVNVENEIIKIIIMEKCAKIILVKAVDDVM